MWYILYKINYGLVYFNRTNKTKIERFPHKIENKAN